MKNTARLNYHMICDDVSIFHHMLGEIAAMVLKIVEHTATLNTIEMGESLRIRHRVQVNREKCIFQKQYSQFQILMRIIVQEKHPLTKLKEKKTTCVPLEDYVIYLYILTEKANKII